MSRARRDRRAVKQSKQSINDQRYIQDVPTESYSPTYSAPVAPKTKNQERYMTAIQSSKIVFGIGPAGTGKTYIATCLAAEQLLAKKIDKIILTRPAVEAGEDMGFLPGEIAEKFGPYLTPYKEVLTKKLGKGFMGYALSHDKIEATPVGYLRGRTFENCMVLVDEAQNLTAEQMKMIMTRIGENCTMVINGDPDQSDIGSSSGLMDAVAKVDWIPQVRVINFTRSDIVRSGIVSDIVQSYEYKFR